MGTQLLLTLTLSQSASKQHEQALSLPLQCWPGGWLEPVALPSLLPYSQSWSRRPLCQHKFYSPGVPDCSSFGNPSCSIWPGPVTCNGDVPTSIQPSIRHLGHTRPLSTFSGLIGVSIATFCLDNY